MRRRRSGVIRSRLRRSPWRRSGPPSTPELFHSGAIHSQLVQRAYRARAGVLIACQRRGGHSMARDRTQPEGPDASFSRGGVEPDLEADDELIPVTRETSRGGNEPPPEV